MRLSVAIFTAIYVAALLQLLFFVSSYSVNLLYWDEWSVVDLVSGKSNLSNIFFYVHNEHRLGFGLILLKAIALVSQWNTRVEMFVSAGILILSSFIAVLLKKKIIGKLTIFDSFIPVIFLNVYQYENLLNGLHFLFVLPLFILVLGLYLFTYKTSLWRDISLVILVLLSTYSHFNGLFFGFFCVIFFAIELRKKFSRSKLFLALISLLITSSYFVNYPFSVLNHNFEPVKSAQFISSQLGSFLFLDKWPSLVLSLFVILVTSIFVIEMRNRKIKFSYIIFCLYAYSLLFLVMAAYGRSNLQGGSVGVASRYVTHLIPLYFAIYLTCLKMNRSFLKRFVWGFFFFFITLHLLLSPLNYPAARMIKDLRESWRDCYLLGNTVDYCNKKVNYLIYPDSDFLQQRLRILELYNQNLFNNND